MAAHNVDGKLLVRQLRKKSITSLHSVNESNPKTSSKTVPTPPPVPSSSTSTTAQTTNTLVASTEVTPTTRIVVVRTTNSTQNEKGETIETNESGRSKSVELPPVLTNGRTSVYLIRRPIPPSEEPRPTQMFQSSNDWDQTGVNRTTTTTTTTKTTTGNDLQHTRSSTPTEEIVIPPDSPSQIHSSSRRTKGFKRRSPFTHTESPKLHSDEYIRTESPTFHSPIDNYSESPKHLSSSSTQPGNSQQTTHRSRPRSRTRGLVRSNSKSRSNSQHRSRSATRRKSPNLYLQSPPPSTHEESKDNGQKRNFFSFSKTKNTVIQVNLLPSKTIENEQQSIRNSQPLVKRKNQRKKSSTSRIESTKSIVLVNPEDQTIAVVENSYLKGEPIKPVIKRQKSSRKNRFNHDNDNRSTEKLVKTSRSYTCIGCLSRHMCLIIIICLILIIIGLAGVGVSAYFLATNSQTNLVPKIVGIAVGGVLAIAALCFLYGVLACIGSRDGYFSYSGDDRSVGGRAFAFIPSTHPNAHHYIPRDYAEIRENNQIPTLNSISTISNNRQKPIVNEINGTTNMTIEMPERILTARKLSPKSHERKLNKVVNNIGHVVNDAKKRYNGDVPTKVIVKIDENFKTIV